MVLWALLLGQPGFVSAQAPESDQAPAGYDQLIVEALAEFDAGRFGEASTLFERAHAMYPNARTLRGVGIANFERREYPRAWVALHDALEHPTRPLTPAQRQDVAARLERAEPFIARVTIPALPEGSQVLIDGAPALRSGSTIVVAPGPHTVIVVAATGERAVGSLNLVAGSSTTLELGQLEAEPLAESTSRETDQRSSPRRERSRTTRRIGLLAGAGGGGATLVLGAIYWANRSSELETCRDAVDSGLLCGNEDALARQRNAGIALTTIGVGAASSLLILGVLTDRDEDVPVACAPQGLGVVCAGRF